MDGWPGYWPGLPPMHYATHCVGPVLGLARNEAAYVSCFPSGTIREEMHACYGSPFAIETCHIKMKDSDTRLFVSKHHHRNFIDAVLSRGQTAAPAEIAQRAAVICHMGSIAAKIGQPLKFDPKTERFEGNDAANAMLTRPMRGPWTI
jgi:hypothetical protein